GCAGRSGTSGTCGETPAAARTAGSGCTCAPRTSACASPGQFWKAWPFVCSLIPEGHAEMPEQGQPPLVVSGSGDEADVQPLHLLDLVVVDLREDDLLPHPEGVIALPVECLAGDALEVADPGEGNVDQPVHELVHPVVAEGDRRADGLPLAELEVGDALPGPGDHRTLAGDGPQLIHRRLQQLVVGQGLAQPHVDDDLLQAGNLVGILEAELLHQGWDALLAIAHLEPGRLGLQPLLDVGLEAGLLDLVLRPALGAGGLLRLLLLLLSHRSLFLPCVDGAWGLLRRRSGVCPSSFDLRVALLAEADLLVALDPDAHPGGGIALLADHLDRRQGDGSRALEDAPVGVGPVAALPQVALHGPQTLHPHPLAVAVDGQAR